jgi:hypothetical protein
LVGQIAQDKPAAIEGALCLLLEMTSALMESTKFPHALNHCYKFICCQSTKALNHLLHNDYFRVNDHITTPSPTSNQTLFCQKIYFALNLDFFDFTE